MQTILVSQQEPEQSSSTLGVGGHVGNLFLGLFLGLLVLLLDRRRGLEKQPSHQPNRWARTLLFWGGALFTLLLTIVFLIGP
jgi:TRAP-type C4-dicarboxylate transport system permease large subunit